MDRGTVRRALAAAGILPGPGGYHAPTALKAIVASAGFRLNHERALLAGARADAARLANDKLRAGLVHRDELRAAVGPLLKGVREAVFRRIGFLPLPAVVINYVRAYIGEALEDLTLEHVEEMLKGAAARRS